VALQRHEAISKTIVEIASSGWVSIRNERYSTTSLPRNDMQAQSIIALRFIFLTITQSFAFAQDKSPVSGLDTADQPPTRPPPIL